MRPLPFTNRNEITRSLISDRPENCSALFLTSLSSSIVEVDMLDQPQLIAVTCQTAAPPICFLYGQLSDQSLIQNHLLESFQNPTDFVIPRPMIYPIQHYWPVHFSLPVTIMDAHPQRWRAHPSKDPRVRLLDRSDTPLLTASFACYPWLWEYFGSPDTLLKASGAAGAFIDGQIASVATTLAVTPNYCELGVVTQPEFRGHGLALECCRALSHAQFENYDRLPCWRTHSGNNSSLKVARQLGLEVSTCSEKYLFVSNYDHVGAYATAP